MATQTRVKTTMALGIRSSYPEIELSLVDCDAGQPRQDFNDDEIADLARSIEANTLLQVAVIRHHPELPGRYLLVAGERRFRAMKLNGTEKAVFKLIEGEGVERSYILSAIENVQRVNLNPIEEALMYQRLHDDEHLSWTEIGELLGRDVNVILIKIKLLTLPPEIQQKVREGNLPQVTALNLTQWRNDEGDYLRMAHDLVAGREPAAIHFRKDTVKGQRLVQARLPKTSDDFASRIVKLAGHVQSMPAVLEAFMKLPPGERKKVLEAIHPSVLGKLRVRFVALYRAVQAVSELMNEFDAVRTGRVKPVTEKSPEQVPVPPSSPAKKTASVVASIVTKPAKEVFSSPSPAPAKLPINGEGSKYTQSLKVSREVFRTLFYSDSFTRDPSVNLSRAALRKIIRSDVLPDTLARHAIQAARSKWRVPPTGTEEEQDMIRLVSRFRRDFGDHQRFDDALAAAMKRDTASDPVEL